MKRICIAIIIAATLWFVMFSPWTKVFHNFWSVMALSAGILIVLSARFAKDWKKQFRFNAKDIITGVASAALLYGIFYAGNEISQLLFDFSEKQVSNVYAIKEGQNPVILASLLLFWVGPAEEIFWRGYIQRTLAGKKGEIAAVVISTLVYALVHIWSFNFMLVMAALVCGGFWGLLYMKNKNLLTVLVSHAVWDVAIFILFPIL
ncbi:CPBP family intramembrane glutamic endopeptidase [Viscerimonas tarda]